jgi:hypothetical protein
MRPPIAPSTDGATAFRRPQPAATRPVAPRPVAFSPVMERFLRQTEALWQRRLVGAAASEAAPPLDGLEVTESTWDDWAHAMAVQRERDGR